MVKPPLFSALNDPLRFNVDADSALIVNYVVNVNNDLFHFIFPLGELMLRMRTINYQTNVFSLLYYF